MKNTNILSISVYQSIGSFFNVRSMFHVLSIHLLLSDKAQINTWIIWEKLHLKCTLPEYSFLFWVCVCVCKERQVNTCLIAVSDNYTVVWRELVTSQSVAHYLWLLDTAGSISVDGISGQWRNFYRHIHGLLML